MRLFMIYLMWLLDAFLLYGTFQYPLKLSGNLKVFVWFQEELKENIGKKWANITKKGFAWSTQCFHTMVTKKTYEISSDFFVLNWKFSNFVPKESKVLRSFLTCISLYFSQLSVVLKIKLKFYTNVQQGLKKLPNELLDLSFYWVTATSLFRSSNTSPFILDVIIVFGIY